MSAAQALAFVERHGIVLEAARHAAIPSLAEAIAGETLHGNWWSHPHGRAIFAITRGMRVSQEVLTCRLVDDKISFVHERLWPALARLADLIPAKRLGRIRETHSERGSHHVEEIPFPQWLDAATVAAGQHLTEADARATLGALFNILAETS